ncbi:hypothetical protein MDA_GLEAN10010147 [Myotis davidii]|uniref:Uncharacterized protein n=1 Tax=Myotis davidii TaxID=225400 RepID=L5MJ31_MYODS|nr:hypothetical protein MDA_GLEAN10010147 [Myotis davidii]
MMFARPSIPLASGKDKSKRAKRTPHVNSFGLSDSDSTYSTPDPGLSAGRMFPENSRMPRGVVWSRGPISSFQTGVQAE